MRATLLLGIVLGGLAAGSPAATPSATVPAAAAGILATGPTTCDALVHRVEAGDTLNRLAIRYRAQAGWYGQADCLQAIREANGLQDRDLLRIGQELHIPRHAAPPPPVAADRVADGAPLRGLYLPAPICGYQAVFARVDSFTAAGGNGVVFDAKDIDGGIAFGSAHPLAVWGKGRPGPVIGDVADFVARLHARDLHVVARLALFLDGELGRQRPDLALHGADGAPWTERGCVWVDPTAPEVQAYHTTLAVELARAGVDEIQVDYVRFPTNGWRGDWQGTLGATAARRRAVITGVVAALHDTLGAMGVTLSADLFGIMAWGRTADLALTGQHVPSLAKHVDVICPMIYPSHFEPGFEGLDNPADRPAEMIAAGVARFRDQAGSGVAIRPWLQAFAWRVSRYDAGYVAAQIAASDRAGGHGWSLWNPAGRYDVALAAVATTPHPEWQPHPAPAMVAAAAAGLTGPASGPVAEARPREAGSRPARRGEVALAAPTPWWHTGADDDPRGPRVPRPALPLAPPPPRP
jgi:hypothetical protein